MKILQFLCPSNPPAEQLKQLMVDQINTWSRLQWLANDPEYTTQPFDLSVWREHTTTAGLWWLDYDSLRANRGRWSQDRYPITGARAFDGDRAFGPAGGSYARHQTPNDRSG